MKNSLFKPFLAICTLLFTFNASAYDFEVDGIYYTITSVYDNTVEVASGDVKYSGEIIIPEQVQFNSVNFLVTGLQAGTFDGSQGGYSSVRYINGAFTNCSSLISIVLPKSITTIGAGVFYNCYNMINIELPSTLKIIGNGAFYGSGITTIIFPESLEKIEPEAFWGSKIVSITISSNIKSIGYCAFRNCNNLTEINIPSLAAWCQINFSHSYAEYTNPLNYAHSLILNGEKLTNIIIPNDISSIGDYCFYGYNDMKSVKFNDSLLSIGAYSFYGNSLLENIILPQNLQTIGASAFSGCQSIKYLELPSSIKSIGNNAFNNCNSIDSIVSKITAPTVTNAFSNTTYMFTPLYVPSGCADKYKQISRWSDFTSIYEMNEFGNVANYYDLTVEVSGSGKIYLDYKSLSNTNTIISVKEGQPLELLLIPDDGFRVKSILINDIEMSDKIKNNTFQIDPIFENTKVAIEFERKPVLFTIKNAENGSVSIVAEYNYQYTTIINSSENWKINAVSFNGVDVTNELNEDGLYITPPITKNSTLSISFEIAGTSIYESSVNNISVFSYNSEINIRGIEVNTSINIYTESGALVNTVRTKETDISIRVPKGIYIVNIEDRSFKVAL